MTVLQARIIAEIVIVFKLAVGLVGVRKWKQLTKPLRLLDVYILFGIAISVVEGVMAFYNIRNLWVIHLNRVVELFFYSCIYFLWRPSKRYGQLLWSAFFVYLIICIIGKFTFEPFYYLDVYSGAISQIIQMGLSGWLLYTISRESGFDWKKNYRFLIVSGIALYAAGFFFFNISFNIMLTLPRPLMRAIWVSNSFFQAIQYTFFLRGFLCKMPIPSQ
jgi:hypothetical protein